MAKTDKISKAFHFGSIIKKNWYLIIFLIVVMPGIIESINIARETDNWTYPIFDLATNILTADSKLGTLVDDLKADPINIIGMAKPDNGIWSNIKYYFHVAWLGYKIFSLVWLIFVPLFAIYSLIKYFNTSEPYQNLFKSTIIFIIYLFVTNTVMMIYNYSQGNIILDFGNSNKFIAYAKILKDVFPFHGIYNLIIYFVSKF